jgi:hypothetical protein
VEAREEDPCIEEIKQQARDDEDYQEVIKCFVRNTDPRSLRPGHPARNLQSIWNKISLEDELLFKGNRIIIPASAQKDILKQLHIAHGGIQKTRSSANQLYFWPGMCNQIKQMIDSCERCQQIRPSQPKEPDIKTVASFPMENVSVDLFHLANKTYLVMVDRYSGFPFVEHLRSTSTEGVTRALISWFHDFGIPVRIRSDGGPQFRSEFQDFCKKLGIIHELASPYNPRSNGHAEAAVKNMKYLLEKYDGNWNKFKSALLEWRNTPSSADPLSPEIGKSVV